MRRRAIRRNSPSVAPNARPREYSAQPLSRIGEAELLRRYHVNGDRRARDELVHRLLPLARRLSGRYARGGSSHEDLFQVASLGLVKAIDRFDLTRGSTLRQFAVPTMLGELKRHVRDTRWALRVPRELQERALEVSRVVGERMASSGASPPLREVARVMGLQVDEVGEAIAAFAAMDPASVDAPFAGSDGETLAYEAMLGEHEAGYDHVEDLASIEPALDVLTDTEREVLALHYVADMTQSQIGRRLGVSQMQVSRTLKRAIERIRAEVAVPATG